MRKFFAIVALIATAILTAGARGIIPGAAADGGAEPHIYGYWLDTEPDDPEFMPGIYSIIPDFGLDLEDPVFWNHGLEAYDGWYHDGKVSGIVTVLHTGAVVFYFQYTYDLESGEELLYEEFYEEVNGFYVPTTATDLFIFQSRLNTRDGLVYGYAYNLADSGDIYWVKADFDDILKAEPIKKAGSGVCYALCYNEADGYFYGVNAKQEFVRIGVSGNQEVISRMPDAEYLTTSMSGMTWSPVDECFYMSCLDKAGTSRLLAISPDGEVSLVQAFEGREYFTFLFCTDEVTPDGPDNPEDPGENPGENPGDSGVDDIVSAAGGYAVYSLDGTLVKTGGEADGDITASLPQGIYVVRAGGKVGKVIVR